MVKVIIAGGRDFQNYNRLYDFCNDVLSKIHGDVEIISGGASGADFLGERYANHVGYNLKYFHADWKQHGKSAGPLRNKEMAEYADMLIAFWDKKSKGTKNMIDEAKAKGLKTHIIYY